MVTNLSGSARILNFRPGGRFALKAKHEQSESQTNVQLPLGAKFAASGSGWYHDDAVETERRGSS